MQPKHFVLSDGLRDALHGAMKDTALHCNFARRYARQLQDSDNPDLWATLDTLTKDANPNDLQDAVSSVLIDGRGLTPAQKEEARALCDHLTGLASGYGAPLVQVTNLPEGVDGYFISRGIVRMAVNARNGMSEERRYETILRRQGETLTELVGKRLHRDGNLPNVQAIYGVEVGSSPTTTAFADVDEFIDEVARHYRHARDGVDHATPVDESLRAEIIDLLSMPNFDFMQWDEMLHGAPILAAEPRRLPAPERPVVGHLREAPRLLNHPQPSAPGSVWPKAWRFHENFATGDRDTIGIYEAPKGLAQFPALLRAVNAALYSLKHQSDLVIKPGELCIFNGSFLLHGTGRSLHPAVGPNRSEPRHVAGMQAQQVMEETGQHGFIQITSEVSASPHRGQ